MTANSDWVFIERDPMETTHLGLEISEKALTSNLKGVITHSKNKSLIGKRIHMPHYKVIDWNNYAIVREGDLFAIDDNGWVPVNRYVRVRKCENEHYLDDDGKVLLYRTEESVEFTNWVEIIDVATDCKNVLPDHIGKFCVAPEGSERLRRLSYSKDYMLHEDEIKFITDGE